MASAYGSRHGSPPPPHGASGCSDKTGRQARIQLIGNEPTTLTIGLFDGIDANIAEFYRNRTAVFAAREGR